MISIGPTGFLERASRETSQASLRFCADSSRRSHFTIPSVVVVRIIVIRGDG
jgi:hypothetical protein